MHQISFEDFPSSIPITLKIVLNSVGSGRRCDPPHESPKIFIKKHRVKDPFIIARAIYFLED